jgi:hypothetical protein
MTLEGTKENMRVVKKTPNKFGVRCPENIYKVANIQKISKYSKRIMLRLK